MWPIEYVELQHIDKLLQCGICYDYMDTSVITSCSHSYCSLCIRKYLHYKTQCPTCFEETFEKDLRKNKLLDEIIIYYLSFKERHDKKFHREESPTANDENSGFVCSTNNSDCKKEQVLDAVEASHKSFDSPTLAAGNTTPHRRKDYQQDVSTPSTSTDLKIPLMFTPKSRKGFQKEGERRVVTCPVCKVDVSQNNINRHLDDCLKRENTEAQPKKSEPKRKPLPKLVLSLMKDNVIRKRLKELGLSSQGDRKALESRLQRYTILYNAECDKTSPRSVSELLRQYEEEENLEKKVQKPSNRLNVNRNTEHNIIEKQRKKYLTANKDSFDQLIARAKHDNGLQETSVRRNILNKNNSNISHEDHVTENDLTVGRGQRSDFLPLNSTNCVDDSDSDSCPLQTYSSANPMNFLAIELASSSDDSTDQCTFKDDSSNHLHKTGPVSYNSIIKRENVKIEKLPPESLIHEETLIHEEIASSNRSRHIVLEDEMDIGIKESVSKLIRIESENREQTKLFPKKSRSGAKYSPDKCVAHSDPRDRWQRELRNGNIDSIVEDIEHFVEDSDIQDDCERFKHEQLNKVKEEYASGSTKYEKENMKTLDKDMTACTPRKRERETALALSDDENVGDRMTNVRKSLRLGLSEAKGFNNENFDETAQDEEKLQNEKDKSQGSYSFPYFSFLLISPFFPLNPQSSPISPIINMVSTHILNV